MSFAVSVGSCPVSPRETEYKSVLAVCHRGNTELFLLRYMGVGAICVFPEFSCESGGSQQYQKIPHSLSSCCVLLLSVIPRTPSSHQLPREWDLVGTSLRVPSRLSPGIAEGQVSSVACLFRVGLTYKTGRLIIYLFIIVCSLGSIGNSILNTP